MHQPAQRPSCPTKTSTQHMEWLTWQRWFDEQGLKSFAPKRWLIVGPRTAARPEVAAFCDWLKTQALLTREAIGDVPDADTVDNLD